MSRYSRFITAILCVLFALTSLCTFAVFAEDIGGGGGADGGDPNGGYSDQGGDQGGGQGGDQGSDQGGGDQGSGEQGGGEQGGGDQGGGDQSSGDQGGGDQGGGNQSSIDQGGGNQGGDQGGNQGSVDQGCGNQGYDYSGNDGGNDNNDSGGENSDGNDGNEYPSYVGGEQKYIPPSETPSTTPAMYDSSKTKIEEKTLSGSDWESIKSKLGSSKPAEIKNGVVDFSGIQDNDVSKENNGLWILILGIALVVLSIAGFTYYTIVTVQKRKNAATVKAGGSKASGSGSQKGGRYRENSDYNDHYDSEAKKPSKVKAQKAKTNKPKNGKRYK